MKVIRKDKVVFVIAIMCMLILTACQSNTIDIESVENIALQCMQDDGIALHVDVDGDNHERIKEILAEGTQVVDEGFVFAEGGYRILVEINDEYINLYPYCGQLSRLRIGEEGSNYIKLNEDAVEELNDIIEQYITIKTGIY